jgi:hypothetical protein
MQVSGTLRHQTRVLAALAVCALLLLFVASCGDDDDDTGSDSATTETTEAASGDPAAFCTAAIDIQTRLTEGPSVDIDQELQTVENDAPDEVAEPARTIAGLLREAQAAPNEEAAGAIFENPEFVQADRDIDEWMLDNCVGVEHFDVTAADYSFDGLPEDTSAGAKSFTVANEGQEPHVLVLFRFNDDAQESLQELLQLSEEEAMQRGTIVAEGFAQPDESDTFFVNLEPGRYAGLCPIPIGTPPNAPPEEGQGGPPHFTEGMANEFEVTS